MREALVVPGVGTDIYSDIENEEMMTGREKSKERK